MSILIRPPDISSILLARPTALRWRAIPAGQVVCIFQARVCASVVLGVKTNNPIPANMKTLKINTVAFFIFPSLKWNPPCQRCLIKTSLPLLQPYLLITSFLGNTLLQFFSLCDETASHDPVRGFLSFGTLSLCPFRRCRKNL